MTTRARKPFKPIRPYILKGVKIGLKAMHLDDAAVATPLFQNLEMLTYLAAHGRAATAEQERAFFDEKLKGKDDEIHFSMFELKRDRYIGGCGLFRIQPGNCAFLGITIADPTCWGKGYGREAVRLLVEYGMFFHNLYNIRLHVFGYNERARRSYLKAGFKEVGRIRGVIMMGGKRYDDIVMDIVRDEVDLSRMLNLVPLVAKATPAARQ